VWRYRCAHCLQDLAFDAETDEVQRCPIHPDGQIEVIPEEQPDGV